MPILAAIVYGLMALGAGVYGVVQWHGETGRVRPVRPVRRVRPVSRKALRLVK